MEGNNKISKNSNKSSLLYALTTGALFLSGIINLVIGTYAAYIGDNDIAAISLGAGLLLLFAATIERFDSIKGLGIEAKTRKLDQKIERADLLLEKIKEISELSGAALIDLSSKTGRMGSAPTPKESYELAQKVKDNLLAMGSEFNDVKKYLDPWVRISCFDLARAITAPLQKAVTERKQEIYNERSKAMKIQEPDNPDLEIAQKNLRELSEYEKEFRNFHLLESKDFPDRLTEIIESSPECLNKEIVDVTLDQLNTFIPSINELKESLKITDREPWFQLASQKR